MQGKKLERNKHGDFGENGSRGGKGTGKKRKHSKKEFQITGY